MLHTPFLPKHEDGRKVVNLPTRWLPRWTGAHSVIKQHNPNNVIIDVGGQEYIANVSRVLAYKPFIPAYSTHLARVAAQAAKSVVREPNTVVTYSSLVGKR